MTLRLLRIPAVLAFSSLLLVPTAPSQTRPAAPESPYGGMVVEDIVARVNDQVITHSDYERSMKDLDQEAKQHGATMQEISEAHKDLLRDLIDRQLWLSKGKELGINGETELIQKLNEIRKQYNLETMDDLEKAAKEQGVSYEDFKANIRNGIITQEVMRDQVGRKIQFTEGEVQRWYEQHKQEYAQPESVKLSEILISTGAGGDDPAKLAEAKAKADDIEAKLHAGGDFSQLAKSFSDGTTAAQGGEFGNFHHGELAKVFEDATFNLQPGQYTEPIRDQAGIADSLGRSARQGRYSGLQRRAAGSGAELLHGPDGTGHARFSDPDARRSLYRYQAFRLHRLGRESEGDQAGLQRVRASAAEEKEEGGAHPFS